MRNRTLSDLQENREDYAQQDPLSLGKTRRTMRNRTLSLRYTQVYLRVRKRLRTVVYLRVRKGLRTVVYPRV